MEKSIFYLFFQNITFLILLIVSGSLGGVVGSVVYYLAFLIPFFATLLLAKKDTPRPRMPKIAPKREHVSLFIPLVAPTVSVILLVSWLSSLFFDGTATVSVTGNPVFVIAINALLPAILEEAFFRYLPISLLTPYSKKAAVFISAALFAIAHMNPHQIPYAFVAGVVFASVDIAFDNILPSVILHFANNLVSVFWIRHFENGIFLAIYISTLSLLSLISLIFVYIKREEYGKLYKNKTKGEPYADR